MRRIRFYQLLGHGQHHASHSQKVQGVDSLLSKNVNHPSMDSNNALETIESQMALGVTIQCDLKWGQHINEIASKASKRLYILLVLKRTGVPPPYLLKVHFAFVRSVWHDALLLRLSDSTER